MHLLEYIHRPKEQISPVCINYLVKILSNLVSTRPYDLYAFFAMENGGKGSKNSSTEQISIEKSTQK